MIEQVWAIVLFLLGAFVLNTCSRLERKEQEFLKDPRNRYGKRKLYMVKPRKHRGTLIHLTGTGSLLRRHDSFRNARLATRRWANRLIPV